MKKTMTLALALSVTVAYAQTDPYDGKVGINTDKPNATMDIKSKSGTTSATKNLELQNADGKKLVTVLDNGFVGINQSKPLAPLHIVSPSVGYGNDIIMEDYTTRSDGRDPSSLIFNRNRGTIENPEVLQKGDLVGNIIFSTKNGGTDNFASARVAEIGAFFTDTTKGQFYIRTSNVDRLFIDEEGKVKVNDLAGTGDRVVLADEKGVLKTGTFTTKGSTPSATETCSATNEGTMYYKTITKNNKQVGVFGFCTRNINGDFVWSYRVGENSIMSGTGAFGTGLLD